MRPHVVVSWTGGMDSTGLAAALLATGHEVTLVTFDIYGGPFKEREVNARKVLLPALYKTAAAHGGAIKKWVTYSGSWVWSFSPDGIEIPTRNKRIIDALIALCMRYDTTNLAVAEYLGNDDRLVTDHVPVNDTDHRSLSAYVFNEYGLAYRLFTLADFMLHKGNKADGFALLRDRIVGGAEVAMQTVGCLYDILTHCGECYKCAERAAAIDHCGEQDKTVYEKDPRQLLLYTAYLRKMQGEQVDPMVWATKELKADLMPRAL